MNICILTHTFPRNEKDSSAAFMKDFAQGLVSVGHRVFVLTPFDKEFKRDNDTFKVVNYKYIWPDFLHRLGYSRSMGADVNLKLINFLLIPFMSLFSTVSLIKLVKKEKIELINVHWILPNGVAAYICSFITKIPYVVTLPGTDVYLAGKNCIFKNIAKIIANASSGIVSNSKFLLKRFLSFKIKKTRTAVIPYPVDASIYRPFVNNVSRLKNMLGISEKDSVILAVGRLVYKKGFGYLLDAIPDVLKELPNTKLIIGGSGDLKGDLIQKTKNNSIEDNVVFAGNINRDEILDYYNLADIFVTPSIIDEKGNFDGGPVTSYESMACGKPQVATNILGVSDIIVDGVNGYKVKPKNSNELSDAIIKLLKDKSKRKNMGEVNRKLIAKEFSIRAIGSKYDEIFKEVIK